MKKTIHIIGAGFSGLSIAYYLKDSYNVIVYEKEAEVGGLLKSEKINGGIVDKAATAIVLNKTIRELFDDIKLDYSLTIKTAKNRYIWRNRLSKMPLSFMELSCFAISLVWGLITKKIKPKNLETIEQWSLRNFNKPVLDFLISPIFQGIYAGNVSKLSASLIIGRKYKVKEKREGIIAPTNGMQDIALKLKEKCEASGVLFKQENKKIENNETVIIATSCNDAAELLKHSHREIADLLSKIEPLSITSINITLRGNYQEIKGFGVLIPRVFNFKTLGILSPSYTFKNRGSNYNETFIVSGANYSDEELINLVEEERNRLFNDGAKIDKTIISKYNLAFPHYTTELESVLDKLRPMLDRQTNIFLTGNYLGGISLSDMSKYNRTLSETIREKVQ